MQRRYGNSAKLDGMFTASEREGIRAALLGKAKADPRLTGGAITGSASVQNEDAWSDIDLAFGVRSGTSLEEVLGDFTATMASTYRAVDWFDVPSEAWIYRVFLLPSSLQVDLAFAPESAFRARAPTFKLQFGVAADLPAATPSSQNDRVGMAWLYALHVRSSLARNRLWQAEYFLCAMRNQVLGLACRRFGLPERDGRGYHLLPKEVSETMQTAFANELVSSAIHCAFQAAIAGLLTEVRHIRPELVERLKSTLDTIDRSASDS